MNNIEGFDKFQKKFSDLANNIEKLDGDHKVPLPELLSSAFLSKHTNFSSVEDLFNASGYKIESIEDFTAIPNDEWDTYITSISKFESWNAMLGEATKGWAVQKLGL